jgi:anti-anti-sigma factor
MMNHKGLDKIDITLDNREGITVVKLSGSFSGDVAYEVLDFVEKKLFKQEHYRFVLDMTGLQKFLSRGVAVIIEISSIVSGKAGQLAIVCNQAEFLTVLEECDIQSLAQIFPTVSEALETMPTS